MSHKIITVYRVFDDRDNFLFEISKSRLESLMSAFEALDD